MAERDKFAILGKLIACFLAKFAKRDLVTGFLTGAIDLAGWHFPDCCANRNALLVNEDDFAVPRHWRNDHGCFPVHNCPFSWQRTRGGSHMVGHNFKMRVGEIPLARNRFPVVFHNAWSVVAAVLSGKLRKRFQLLRTAADRAQSDHSCCVPRVASRQWRRFVSSAPLQCSCARLRVMHPI